MNRTHLETLAAGSPCAHLSSRYCSSSFFAYQKSRSSAAPAAAFKASFWEVELRKVISQGKSTVEVLLRTCKGSSSLGCNMQILWPVQQDSSIGKTTFKVFYVWRECSKTKCVLCWWENSILSKIGRCGRYTVPLKKYFRGLDVFLCVRVYGYTSFFS